MRFSSTNIATSLLFSTSILYIRCFSFTYNIKNSKRKSLVGLEAAVKKITERDLLLKANELRKRLDDEYYHEIKQGKFFSKENLSHPSCYNKTKKGGSGSFISSSKESSLEASTTERGFCNYIIPPILMVGQYPGQNPEPSGPNEEEVMSHFRSIMILDGNISLFCCLQDEVPAQDDYTKWEEISRSGNGVYLQDEYWRRIYPEAFTHYAPVVQQVLDEESRLQSESESEFNHLPLPIRYIHAPIIDLDVPSSEDLYELLYKLLFAMVDEQRHIYLHCWGGRGRAGVVSACLLSLVFPELNVGDSLTLLEIVQRGYDTRKGAKQMPFELSKSPQTKEQRDFVVKFAKEIQFKRSKLSL